MSVVIGPDLGELPSWRVALILLFFFVVATIWEGLIVMLERYLRRREKRGMLKVLKQLKRELLVLGMLSMALAAFEKPLLEICISCSGSDCLWTCPTDPSETPSTECQEAIEFCGEGKEPLLSPLALLQAHILVFVVAVMHLAYTATSMAGCLWQIQRWRKYELRAVDPRNWEIRSRHIHTKLGGNWLVRFFYNCFGMLAYSISEPIYIGLRRLFIERFDIDQEFDFHSFMVESVEEEYANILSMELASWILVILWMGLPRVTYATIWLSSLSALALFMAGVKLQEIVNRMAEDAYAKYGRGSKVHLARLSTGVGPLGTVGAVDCTNSTINSARPDAGGSLDEFIANLTRQSGTPPNPTNANPTNGTITGGGRGRGAGGLDVDVQVPGRDFVLSGDLKAVQNGMGKKKAEEDASQLPVSQSFAFGFIHDGSSSSTALGAEELSVEELDIEAQHTTQQPDPDSDSDPCRSSKTRWWKLSWSWWRSKLHTTKTTTNAGAASAAAPIRALQRSRSFSACYKGLDAASLFWFGKPQLVMRIIQLVYFLNSLSVATLIFGLWQDVVFDWRLYGGWELALGMLIFDVVLAVFISIRVVPTYALTTAVGSHTEQSLIELALKKNIKPNVARALQRMSAEPRPPAGGPMASPFSQPVSFEVEPGPSGQLEVTGIVPFPPPAALDQQPLALPHSTQTSKEALPGIFIERRSTQGSLQVPLPLSLVSAAAGVERQGSLGSPREAGEAGGPRPVPSPFVVTQRPMLARSSAPASVFLPSTWDDIDSVTAAGLFDRAGGGEHDDTQKSVTRLLGAIYSKRARQLQEQSLLSSRPSSVASSLYRFDRDDASSVGVVGGGIARFASTPQSDAGILEGTESEKDLVGVGLKQPATAADDEDRCMSLPSNLHKRPQLETRHPTFKDITKLFEVAAEQKEGASVSGKKGKSPCAGTSGVEMDQEREQEVGEGSEKSSGGDGIQKNFSFNMSGWKE